MTTRTTLYWGGNGIKAKTGYNCCFLDANPVEQPSSYWLTDLIYTDKWKLQMCGAVPRATWKCGKSAWGCRRRGRSTWRRRAIAWQRGALWSGLKPGSRFVCVRVEVSCPVLTCVNFHGYWYTTATTHIKSVKKSLSKIPGLGESARNTGRSNWIVNRKLKYSTSICCLRDVILKIERYLMKYFPFRSKIQLDHCVKLEEK